MRTGLRPYQCTTCLKSFSQKCALRLHMLSHTAGNYQSSMKLENDKSKSNKTTFHNKICENMCKCNLRCVLSDQYHYFTSFTEEEEYKNEQRLPLVEFYVPQVLGGWSFRPKIRCVTQHFFVCCLLHPMMMMMILFGQTV